MLNTADLILGDPRTWEDVQEVPLLNEAAPIEVEYDTLADALAAGTLEVTEIPHPEVSMLRAHNRGTRRVLLVEGQELEGGRQNRCVYQSVMLAPSSVVDFRVSCVERHRWFLRSPRFTHPGRTYPPQERGRRHGARGHDQHVVWDDIEGLHRRDRVASWSGAIGDIYGRHAERAAALSGAFPPMPHQVGAVYVVGATVVGLDLFESPSIFARFSSMLAHGLAVSVACRQAEPGVCPQDGARVLLQRVVATPCAEQPTPGEGTAFAVDGVTCVGGALMLDGRLIHAAVFPLESRPALRECGPQAPPHVDEAAEMERDLPDAWRPVYHRLLHGRRVPLWVMRESMYGKAGVYALFADPRSRSDLGLAGAGREPLWIGWARNVPGNVGSAMGEWMARSVPLSIFLLHAARARGVQVESADPEVVDELMAEHRDWARRHLRVSWFEAPVRAAAAMRAIVDGASAPFNRWWRENTEQVRRVALRLGALRSARKRGEELDDESC